MSKIIKCGVCGKEFAREASRQLYCSEGCKRKRRNEQLRKHRRKNGYAQNNIGVIITCQNPDCNNRFIKKTGMHKYCSAECRHIMQTSAAIPKPAKHKSLAEIAKLMNEMGYGNRYGLFCREHPELLNKEA